MEDEDLNKLAAEAGLTEEETAKLEEMQDAEAEPTEGEATAEQADEKHETAPERKPDEPEVSDKPKKKPSIREEMVEYRKRAKEAESKLEEAAKAREDWENRDKEREARFAALVEQIKADREKPAAPEQPPQPTLEDNPVEYFNGRISELADTVKTLAQNGHQQEAIAKHNEAVLHDISTYRQQAPDYDTALQHLVKHLDAIYEASGVPDPQMRYNLCAEQIRNVTANAISNGVSACDRLYKMAGTVGYQPPSAKPTNGNGKISGDDINRIAAGQREASGLPGDGDSRGSGLTYAKIADMSTKELDELVNSKYGGKLENLLAAAQG
jgi:hypothetical protein